MRMFLHLLHCELKKALAALPQLLAGAIALIIFIGAIAFCCVQILYHRTATGAIPVALVVEEDSSMMDWAMDFTKEMESTSSLFSFTIMNDNDARNSLKNGSVSALMVIPEGVIDSILSGTNIPIQVIFPSESDIATVLLQELTMAGGKTLASAQAGIYTTTDLYLTYGHKKDLKASYDEINRTNLKYALARDLLFRRVNVSSTGSLSTENYYLCSAILLFLFLAGTSCSSFLSRENRAFYQKLKHCQSGALSVTAARMLTTFLLYLGMGLFLFCFCLFVFFQDSGRVFPVLSSMADLAAVILFTSAFVCMVYDVTRTVSEGILALSITSLLMLFVSGIFIPSAFFPQALRQIGQFLPTSFQFRALGGIYTETLETNSILALFVWTLVCFVISWLSHHVRKEHLS